MKIIKGKELILRRLKSSMGEEKAGKLKDSKWDFRREERWMQVPVWEP